MTPRVRKFAAELERLTALPVTLQDERLTSRERSEEHTSELQSLAYLICRRPPRPPLFPYTTLFRSDATSCPQVPRGPRTVDCAAGDAPGRTPDQPGEIGRAHVRTPVTSLSHMPPPTATAPLSLHDALPI